MSEVKDNDFYNFYDFIKLIYVYSHVKTELQDSSKQKVEKVAAIVLMVLSGLFFLCTIFKVIVILIYFFFMQALTGFIKFLTSLFKTKCNVSLCSNFKNSISFLSKICKRIYTFNFYIYENFLINSIMTSSFIIFLAISFLFFIDNVYRIDEVEKPELYLIYFYLDFEFTMLVELLCSCFYSCRSMIKSTFFAIGLFITMDCILIFGYMYTNLLEDEDGSFENQEPQKIINIVFNIILLSLNSTSLYKIITYDKNSKLIIYNFGNFNIIDEAFKLLFQEKNNFYLAKNNNFNNFSLEETRILNISERYKLSGIYYNGDKKQIFKRVDRYESKIYLIIIFTILIAYNIIEIIYNITFLTVFKDVKIDTDLNKNLVRIKITMEVLAIINLITIIILSILTFTKLKIASLIYY